MAPTTNKSQDINYLQGKEGRQAPLCGSYRLFVTIVACMTLCTSLISQVSMNTAIVCMVDTDRDHNNIITGGNNNGTLDANGTHHDRNPWKRDWDSKTKGWVIAVFFIGYCFMQIPGGVLVNRFGPRATIVTGLFTTSIFHLLTVPTIRFDVLPALYVVRLLAGLSCGCLFPTAFHLVANWAPHQEKSRLFGINGLGCQAGNSFAFLVALFGCELDFQGGWPIVFYAIGLIQIILAIVIVVAVTDSPASNRYINPIEAKYIADCSLVDHDQKHNNRIPVSAILRSIPVWGFIIAQLGSEWTYYTMYTQLPLFLGDFLRLSPMTTNILCSIPMMSSIPLMYVVAILSDKIIGNGTLSVASVRKINDVFAKILMAIPLIIMSYLPQGAWVEPLLLYFVISIGFSGIYSGYIANPGDIGPAHTGFLVGLGQGLTTWVSFVIPVLNASITSESAREGWQLCFYICLIIAVVSTLCFCLMASGQLQPWARTEINEETPIKLAPNGIVETRNGGTH